MPKHWTAAKVVNPKLRLRETERERRTSGVRNALGSLALEGLDPGPEARAIFDRYIDGELTIDELMPAIFAWDAKPYHAG